MKRIFQIVKESQNIIFGSKNSIFYGQCFIIASFGRVLRSLCMIDAISKCSIIPFLDSHFDFSILEELIKTPVNPKIAQNSIFVILSKSYMRKILSPELF